MNSILRQWYNLCWNIRGINSEDKHNALRTHIDSSGCAIICLQETKMASFDHSYIRKICPKRFDKFICFPSDGNSGGLVVIWNSAIFKGELIENISWATKIKFYSTQSTSFWYLANTYCPCSGEDRDNFLQWMYDLHMMTLKIGYY
jgi:exonuclease III